MLVFLRCSIALALISACPLDATAGWLDWTGANLPVCRVGGDQTQQVCVTDGAGGSIVAWQDQRSVAPDIFAQHVLASGELDAAWPAEGQRICAAPNAQQLPSITTDGAGGAIVTWHDYRSGVPRVYAQRVSSTGVAEWTADGVALCTYTGNQMYPAICADGAGGAIVTWLDFRGGTGHIYAQRISDSGVLLWTTEGLGVFAAFSEQNSPKIVSDATGGAIIVWNDNRDYNSDLYAQRVSATGVVQWSSAGVPLCTATGEQTISSIVPDAAGGAIVVWQDRRSGAGDVYSQRVDATGATQWTANGAPLCTVAGEQIIPVTIPDSNGGAITAWMDTRFGVSDIFAQRVSANGVPLWAAEGVALCTATGDQQNPGICSDGAGGAIVSWQDYRGGPPDIYAQRTSATGAPQWTANGVAISHDDYYQYSPVLVADGSNGAVAVWQDYRNGTGADLYAQRISSDGTLGASVRPTIAGARDTPNDQGGTLKLMWNASPLDADPYRAVADYRVWRSVPPNVAQAALSMGARPATRSDDALLESGRAFRTTPTAAGTIYWEYLSTHTARGFAGYSTVVRTLCDSVPGSNPYTLFMIEARCTDGVTYWDSAPDSGYSVDNLSPPIPAPFVANYSGAVVALHWVPSPAADFAEFRLHRGISMDFVPGPSNLIFAGPDTGFVDQSGIGGFYKLAAVDVHRNVGRFALVSPTLPTSTLASLVSSEWTGSAVSLVWYGAGLSGLGVDLYRSEDGAAWSLIARLSADGEGYVRYSDATVLPRHRYSYRLGILDEGTERIAGETSLEIPGSRLAIRAVASNPVRGDALSFVVALASAEPASARVLDLAGRVVREQIVQPDLSGRLTVSLGSGPQLRPGVYLLELRQADERAVTRFVYLR